MAKKEETISLIDTFSEFKELKNIDRTTMVSVLEESFRSVIAKMFGTDENYDVIVNPDKGDFEIWRNREVVADEDLTNPNMQISLTEAQKIDASYEVGEEVTDEVIFAKFGRRAILNLRQTLASKILELEKDSIYNKYIDKVGTIIIALIYYSLSSNSDFKMRNTSSTVSSSRSVFSISISRGAFNTDLAVSMPIALIASITHPSISSLNSSR